MNRRFAAGLASLFLVFSVSTPLAAQERPTLDKQLALFLEWFPGRYDSAQQAERQAREGLPAAERNYRRHSIFRRVDLSAFGEIVFYAEQSRGADLEEVYRQRVYVIEPDAGRGALRLRVHVPKDQAALLGAYRDPSLLADLTPADTVVWPGCDLFWKFEDDHFVGRLDEGACRFDSPAYGSVMLDEYLLLSASEMHFADRGLSLEGEYMFGMRGETPTIAPRVRSFVCETQLEEGTARNWLHDQLGSFEVEMPDERITVRLRRLQAEGLGLEIAQAPAHEPRLLLQAGGAVESLRFDFEELEIACSQAPERLYDDQVE